MTDYPVKMLVSVENEGQLMLTKACGLDLEVAPDIKAMLTHAVDAAIAVCADLVNSMADKEIEGASPSAITAYIAMKIRDLLNPIVETPDRAVASAWPPPLSPWFVDSEDDEDDIIDQAFFGDEENDGAPGVETVEWVEPWKNPEFFHYCNDDPDDDDDLFRLGDDEYVDGVTKHLMTVGDQPMWVQL